MFGPLGAQFGVFRSRLLSVTHSLDARKLRDSLLQSVFAYPVARDDLKAKWHTLNRTAKTGKPDLEPALQENGNGGRISNSLT